MGSLPEEVLRILFLDGANRLIADEQLQHGSVRHLALYPRTIFRRALEHGAGSLILVHNHPGGNPEPSQDDIAVTRTLSELGRALDITIIGHIIVTATRSAQVPMDRPANAGQVQASAHILRESQGSGRDEQPGNRSIALEGARSVARRRTLRRSMLGAAELFGEPAWDMLIDLFIHHCEGKAISTSALCMAVDIPMSSALRLVHKLCEARLVTRRIDPADGRRQFVDLTPDTISRLQAYFCAEERRQ